MEVKDFKKFSYSDFDNLIADAKSQICALDEKIKSFQLDKLSVENNLKNLRTHKLLKIVDDAKPIFLNSEIDFSLDDFQKFLQSKKVSEKVSRSTSQKKLRDKKISADNV